MTCIIYRITCLVNAKVYIGLTQTTLRRRWRAHVQSAKKRLTRVPLHDAIFRYGEAAFSIEPLLTVDTRAESNSAEIRLISEYNSRLPSGYNVTSGGDGGGAGSGVKWTPERRQKTVAALTGRKIHPDVVARVAAKLRGRKLAPAHAAIIRTIGRKNKGKKRTKEQIDARRIIRKTNYLEKSLHKAVGCSPSGERFRATLFRNGKTFPVGTFDTLEQARHAWRIAAAAHIEEIRTGTIHPMFEVNLRARRIAGQKAAWVKRKARRAAPQLDLF